MYIKCPTGNPIVDEVGKMNLSGNIIPETWYHTITNENGKPNLLAINILADIVYWYRPTEIRDEKTQAVSYSKKFNDADFLQRSYKQLTEKFGMSDKQVRCAIIRLEELGVIKRHFRTLTLNGYKVSNVMFLELFPDVLKRLTYLVEDANPIDQKGNTSLQNGSIGMVHNDTSPLDSRGSTYTKNTTENTTETITTSDEDDLLNKEDVVDEIKNLFAGYGMSDKDIVAIASVAKNDTEKCKKAKNVLDKQNKTVNNITGWLIDAIKNDYALNTRTASKRSKSFNNFIGRQYSSEELGKLEQCLLEY